MLENQKIFCHSIATLHFLISVICVISFQYLYIGILWKKVYFLNFFIYLELIPIRIRQSDVDPTRSQSGSTTLIKTLRIRNTGQPKTTVVTVRPHK
jgi:hypothetical protein